MRAFEVTVNKENGTCTLVLAKWMLGSLSGFLKRTPGPRKGLKAMRKLGFALQEAGDLLYGNIMQTESEKEEV